MKWLRGNIKIPESSISDEDIEKLKEKAQNVATKVEKMEKAVLDGEHTWMLVKCYPDEDPVCKPKGFDPCAT
jgi:hypothetical protein